METLWLNVRVPPSPHHLVNRRFSPFSLSPRVPPAPSGPDPQQTSRVFEKIRGCSERTTLLCVSGSQKRALTGKRCVHVIYEESALGEREAMHEAEGGQEEPGRARSRQSPA